MNAADFTKRFARHTGAFLVPAVALAALAAVLVIWSPRRVDSVQAGGVWTCSMHPQVRLNGPGRCPICDMPLIPAGQLGSQQKRLEARAGVATATVAYRELDKEIRATGRFDFNERRVAFLTARIDGRVDRVFADVTGTQVKANDHLVDIYSPQLLIAQAELLDALRAREQRPSDRFAESGLEAARTKLKLLGLLPEQIAEIERTRKDTTHVTIFAPIGGVIVEKNVREQQYVKEGDMLYRIAELDPIWLYVDIYERDLAWVRYGQPVDVAVEAYPGEVFNGTIVFIDPVLNDTTRTVKVRVNLSNPRNRLKPGMYASAIIRAKIAADGGPQPTGIEGKYFCPMHPEVVKDEPGRCPTCEMELERVPGLPIRVETVSPVAGAGANGGAPGQVLAVPMSAVLETGRRQIAYRKRKDGAYEMVELTLGPLGESKDERGSLHGYFPVRGGLSPGDEVVVQGGFLLDSQRQIEGMPSLLNAVGHSAESPPLETKDGQPNAPVMSGEHKH